MKTLISSTSCDCVFRGIEDIESVVPSALLLLRTHPYTSITILNYRSEHWLLLIQFSSGKVVFFDSLARDLAYYNPSLAVFAYKHFSSHRQFHQLHSAIQSQFSPLCGYYCLYFTYRSLVSQEGLTGLVSKFSLSSLEANDTLLLRWFRHRFER